VLAFSFERRYSENAIFQKLLDMGLLKEEDAKKTVFFSILIQLEMPKEWGQVLRRS
jgi:hypothetical protein